MEEFTTITVKRTTKDAIDLIKVHKNQSYDEIISLIILDYNLNKK